MNITAAVVAPTRNRQRSSRGARPLPPSRSRSRCADCHFANSTAASRWHLSEWDHSAHGRADVGCEGCHGGDPSTFESFLAHRGHAGRAKSGEPGPSHESAADLRRVSSRRVRRLCEEPALRGAARGKSRCPHLHDLSRKRGRCPALAEVPRRRVQGLPWSRQDRAQLRSARRGQDAPRRSAGGPRLTR